MWKERRKEGRKEGNTIICNPHFFAVSTYLSIYLLPSYLPLSTYLPIHLPTYLPTYLPIQPPILLYYLCLSRSPTLEDTQVKYKTDSVDHLEMLQALFPLPISKRSSRCLPPHTLRPQPSPEASRAHKRTVRSSEAERAAVPLK